ncbi:MAG: hypothetical protein D6698_08910 [Gammaproteobacteria bacterium]|nr:MAG: hypothetical protein D6698_08910 [Gammaproteobacteria bacterium]
MRANFMAVFLVSCAQIFSGISVASTQEVAQNGGGKGISQETDQLIQHYRILLQNQNARPSVKGAARHRLVELYLRKAIEQPDNIDEYSIVQAIQILEYQQATHDDWVSEDEILYELAHAYSLQGDQKKSIGFLREIEMQYPQSPYYTEAIYRIADYEFAAEDYKASAGHFRTLLEIQDAEGKIEMRTRYMMAWSLYKAVMFSEAEHAFSELLAVINNGDESDDFNEIHDDSIRGLGLAIEAAYSPDEISAHIESSFSMSPFLPDLYQFVAEHAFRDERYQDAAKILYGYAKNHPDNDDAPMILIKAAGILETAGFYPQGEKIREVLIEDYPVTSHFWSTHSGEQYSDVIATIREWTYEAAKTWHARARKSGKNEDYSRSIQYYRLYLDQFPDGEKAYDARYALAEVWYETAQFDLAARQYESVAYQWPEKHYAQKAAYAGLIALKKSHSDRWIDSAIRFVTRFHDHDEVTPVREQILATLQEQKDWERLATVIHLFLAGNQEIDPVTRIDWIELLGDAHSSMRDYIRSSKDYLEALNAMGSSQAEDKERIQKKRAAALYHAAELLREQQQFERASEIFMQAYLTDRSGVIAPVALYDAASTAKQAGEDEKALAWFEKYEQQYPEQAVRKKVPAVLASIYQSRGDYGKAANELEKAHSLMPEISSRKSFLWQAHELYEQEGKLEDSARSLKILLNRYTTSQKEKIQTMQKLFEIRKKQNDKHAAHYWLNKLAGFPAKNPDISSQVSIVGARLLLAEEDFDRFSKARLDLPLQKTVPEMKITLEKLIRKYENVMEFPIADDTTQALNRMGQAYRIMAEKILQSPRPDSLSADEKEAYEFSLEDLAFQYEEQAIALFRKNHQFLLEQGVWTPSIRASLAELARLLPAEFDKAERHLGYYETM